MEMAAKKTKKRAARNTRSPSRAAETYDLRLYVAGQTPRSTAAVANLRRICETYLAGKYTIEIIDLMKTPHLARDHPILAVPTLVRQLPSPLKRIIGDLSDTERALVGLDLRRSA
jgi:circadian clock protein KaiB